MANLEQVAEVLKRLECSPDAVKEFHQRTLQRLHQVNPPSPFPVVFSPNTKRIQSDSLCQSFRVYPRAVGQSAMTVICSICIEADGLLWYHVSFSYPERIPEYKDVCFVREWFVPEHLPAYQVHPPRDQHINHHQYCLHLWVPMEGQELPDFRKAGTI